MRRGGHHGVVQVHNKYVLVSMAKRVLRPTDLSWSVSTRRIPCHVRTAKVSWAKRLVRGVYCEHLFREPTSPTRPLIRNRSGKLGKASTGSCAAAVPTLAIEAGSSTSHWVRAVAVCVSGRQKSSETAQRRDPPMSRSRCDIRVRRYDHSLGGIYMCGSRSYNIAGKK